MRWRLNECGLRWSEVGVEGEVKVRWVWKVRWKFEGQGGLG